MEIRLQLGHILGLIGAITAMALYLGGRWFNHKVDCLKATHADEGYVSLEVIAGVGGTVALLLPFLMVWQGWLDGLLIAVVFGLGFAASGLPMVLGDLARFTRAKRNDR